MYVFVCVRVCECIAYSDSVLFYLFGFYCPIQNVYWPEKASIDILQSAFNTDKKQRIESEREGEMEELQ